MKRLIMIFLTISLVWSIGLIVYGEAEESSQDTDMTQTQADKPAPDMAEPVMTEYGEALEVQVIETENGRIRLIYLKDDEQERIVITDHEDLNYITKGTLNKQTGDAIFEDIPKPGVWGIRTKGLYTEATGYTVLSKSFVIPEDSARMIELMIPMSRTAIRLAQSAAL